MDSYESHKQKLFEFSIIFKSVTGSEAKTLEKHWCSVEETGICSKKRPSKYNPAFTDPMAPCTSHFISLNPFPYL